MLCQKAFGVEVTSSGSPPEAAQCRDACTGFSDGPALVGRTFSTIGAQMTLDPAGASIFQYEDTKTQRVEIKARLHQTGDMETRPSRVTIAWLPSRLRVFDALRCCR